MQLRHILAAALWSQLACSPTEPLLPLPPTPDAPPAERWPFDARGADAGGRSFLLVRGEQPTLRDVVVFDWSLGAPTHSYAAPEGAHSLVHDGALLWMLCDDGLVATEPDSGEVQQHWPEVEGEHLAFDGASLMLSDQDGVHFLADSMVVRASVTTAARPAELFSVGGVVVYVDAALRDLSWELDPIGPPVPALVEQLHVLDGERDVATDNIRMWDEGLSPIGFQVASGSDGDVVVSAHYWWVGDEPVAQTIERTDVRRMRYAVTEDAAELVDDGALDRIEIPLWVVLDATSEWQWDGTADAR